MVKEGLIRNEKTRDMAKPDKYISIVWKIISKMYQVKKHGTLDTIHVKLKDKGGRKKHQMDFAVKILCIFC